MNNHLQAKAKIDYDYKEDVIFFYNVSPKKGHEYDKSHDIDGLIIDLDSHDHVVAIELLDASKKLNVSKGILAGIRGGKFSAMISKERINLAFFLTIIQRNKEKIATLNLERFNKDAIKETALECVIPN